MNIKSWLRRLPQPAKLRFDRKDVISVGEGKNKWRDVCDAILVRQPHILEALNSDGELIRATELESEGQTTADDVPKTEKASELAQLGKLLLDAYRAGAEQHAAAYELAFQENTKLVTVLSQRLGGLEQAWQATLEQRAADLAAGEDGASNPLAPMMHGLAMKMMTTTAEAATSGNGKANGHRKGKSR